MRAISIIGTPVTGPGTSTVGIFDQSTVAPRVTSVEGVLSTARLQAVQVEQAQDANIQWVMRTDIGDQIDLTALNLAPLLSSGSSSSDGIGSARGTIRVRVTEALSIGQSNETVELTAGGIDPPAGLVGARLTTDIVSRAGVYLLDWRADDADGRFLRSSRGYLIVNRGQYGDPEMSRTGPPTVSEIRLYLRDNSAEDNFLLGTLEWDLAEVAAAIVRCVSVWNESRPPLRGPGFDTRTFPFFDLWISGIHAQLYRIAAAAYRREDVNYSAAGVEFADKRKAQEYEMLSQKMWQEFAREVKLRKVNINLLGGFRYVGSPYAVIGRRWRW